MLKFRLITKNKLVFYQYKKNFRYVYSFLNKDVIIKLHFHYTKTNQQVARSDL